MSHSEIPFFSIIVPVYNVGNYLVECIDSILNQTFANFELILVDDGSTDGGDQICDEYTCKDKRIRVIHQQNKGLVGARVTGITNAIGEYSVYVDGDDWIEKDELKNIYEVVREYPVDVIEFGLYKEYEGLTIDRECTLPEGYTDDVKLWSIVNEQIKTAPCFVRPIEAPLWCKAVRVEIMRKVQCGIDRRINWGEDNVTTFSILHEAKSIYVMHKQLYHYRVHSNSMMHKDATTGYQIIKGQLECTWNKYRLERSHEYLNYVLSHMFTLCCPGQAIEMFVRPLLSNDAKIVIYGKGVFAKLILGLLYEKGINVVDNVDSVDIGRLNKIVFDEIFIAITIGQEVEKCMSKLISVGVSSDKIKYIRWENISNADI